MMTTIEKIDQIRNQMRRYRRNLAFNRQQQAVIAATTQLTNASIFIKSQHIACYMPVRNELDTCQLIQTIWQTGKQCYLPAIDPIRDRSMNFRAYSPCMSNLPLNSFSIPEPNNQATTIPPWALDLVITPLLAFDNAGNRLGSGCGYYDRIFATIRHWPRAPLLCGFAYQQQQLTKLPVQPWDVPMDYIITDKTIIQANR